MYNSSYSQTNFGLAAKKMHKSKGKSCGYYLKIAFFFSSLIQSLIIASLVLFLVYGQPEHTVEEKRLQELGQRVSNLTMENFILRGKEKNLTKALNTTLTAKLASDKLVSELRKLANTSSVTIKSLQTSLSRSELEKKMITPRSCPPAFCPDPNDNNKRLQSMIQQSDEMLQLVKANFTQTAGIMRAELDSCSKDKNGFHLEAIGLRRDKAYLEEELRLYEKTCKEDFVKSLQGIPNVTMEFLKRIDDLFSKHISFQLTCDKQKIQLEDIRENCSSLSREVENKLQRYLNLVGDQVTKINGENAKIVITNKRLKEDADWCNQNRTGMLREHHKTLEQFQLKIDQDSEKLLLENRKLKGDSEMKEKLLSVNANQIKMLTNNIETLNISLISCKRNNPFLVNASPNTGGASQSSAGLNKPSIPWPGTGSSGAVYPSNPGAGSSTRWGGTGTIPLNAPLPGIGVQSNPGFSMPGSSRPGLTSLSGAGLGMTGLGSSVSAGGLGKPASGSVPSAGSNPFGSNTALGGAKASAGGTEIQTMSQTQINLHLKELHRYSHPI
ncbi:hypothetical protein DNTS_008059 [Danionella cerebrum]|uniref:Plasmalemma vesicle-associated protein n=1 Tax=Danionella cerebrum TaxID=2873325 RepID=A0A553NLI2_9TELE|nr:hypothetical protein DNTS_008059 [Danionella translucida]